MRSIHCTPGKIFPWWFTFDRQMRAIFAGAGAVAELRVVAAAIVALREAARRASHNPGPRTYGSVRRGTLPMSSGRRCTTAATSCSASAVAIARELLISRVVSAAMSILGLYCDPLMARHADLMFRSWLTRAADFRLAPKTRHSADSRKRAS